MFFVIFFVFFKVTQFCYVFDGLLSMLESTRRKFAQEEEDVSQESKDELWEAMYIQACYWSFGASIVNEARSTFDKYMKKTCGLMEVQDKPNKLAVASKLEIEDEKNLFVEIDRKYKIKRKK